MSGKYWFNCRVRYQSLDDSGQEIKTSDDFMLDAYSYTEAEAEIHRLMNERLRGSFEVTQITKTNFKEVVGDEDAEKWFRVKMSLIAYDEESEKEKQTTQYIAVAAEDIREAWDNIKEHMRGTGLGYVIPGISFLKIKEVFFLEKAATENSATHIREFLGGGTNSVDPETGEIIEG